MKKHKRITHHKPIKRIWKSYKEYLKSSDWYTKRTIKLKESGFRCQVCNAKDYLEVHHRTYRNIFHEPLTDLVVLCHECHNTFHQTRNANKLNDEEAELAVIEMLKKEGYESSYHQSK